MFFFLAFSVPSIVFDFTAYIDRMCKRLREILDTLMNARSFGFLAVLSFTISLASLLVLIVVVSTSLRELRFALSTPRLHVAPRLHMRVAIKAVFGLQITRLELGAPRS